MNFRQAVARIKKHNPKTLQDFKNIGLLLRFIDAGVFREVYKIKDIPLVVKFPLNGERNGFREGKVHSTVEVRKIKKLSKNPCLKRHLPTVYHHDRKSGLLVMSWHPPFKCKQKMLYSIGGMLSDILYEWKGIEVSDIHEGNVRCRNEKTNELIICDLGY